MAHGDLSDEKWAKFAPLLPPLRSGQKGHPFVEHRKVLNGIFWRLRTGSGWRDIPERYGPYQTCYDRFVRFERRGLWLQILQALQAEKDADGQLDWQTACADGSVIRAQKLAAGAPHHPSQANKRGWDKPAQNKKGRLGLLYAHTQRPRLMQALLASRLKRQVQRREGLGYSQGGFSTKIHLVCEGKGRPLGATLSPGQAHESKHLAPSLDAIRVPRLGAGRPKKRPKWLLGDRAYNGRPCRTVVRQRGIRALIPTKLRERERRKRAGQKGGRPYYFDKEHYKQRNVVERCFSRLKQFRAVATRYDKLGVGYLASVTMAMIMCWLD